MAGYEGRGTIIQIGDGTAGASKTVSGCTVSSGVATITSTAHGLSTGDVVLLASIGGMTGLDDYFLIDKVDANSFKVYNGGISGTYTSGGTAVSQNTTGSGGWISIAAVQGYELGQQADRLDVSAMDTPLGFREYRPGMKDGSFSLTLNFLPNSASHGVVSGLAFLAQTGAPRWFRRYYPQISTAPSPYTAWIGLILDFNESGDTESAIQLSVNGAATRTILRMPGA